MSKMLMTQSHISLLDRLGRVSFNVSLGSARIRMASITTETRKRGVFGWIVAVFFWAWNAFMTWCLISGLAKTSDHYLTIDSEAGRTGAAIGAAIGIGALLFMWVAGAVILGLMMIFTRGRRMMITQDA